MKKAILALLIFSSLLAFTQSNDTANSIILKVKESHRSIIKTDGLSHIELNQFLKSIGNTQIKKIFPRHSPPIEDYDKYGNKLVDLSLMFELKYESDIQQYILAQKLMNIGLFEYVEAYPDIELFAIPNDSLISEQFHLSQMKVFEAWDIEQGDTNVVIGITDTGTDRLHEDLKNIKFNYSDPVDGIDNDNDGFIDNFYGWDIGDNNNNPQVDLIGHGAFVSGISSATVNNNKGIAGVGNKAKYLPVKISDDKGSLLHAYEGIVYAADQNCNIINASWGGITGSRYGQDIVNYATYNKNALVIAAAGNSNNTNLFYPASYKNVLSIAAVDSLDQKWSGSSFGHFVDLSAPGDKVFSSWPGDAYFGSSGTSFASPAVAGIAALVKSHFDSLTALQIGEKIRVNTDKIDTISPNIAFKYSLGSGRANAFKALSDSVLPSLRLKEYNFTRTGNQALDTVFLYAEIINYLKNTHSAKAVLSTNSPYISIIDSVFNIGSLNTLSDTNNQGNLFKILIMPNIPLGFQTDLKITYSDTAYYDFEFVRLNLNEDFDNIDTNNITLSLTSNGAIGFTNESKSQGSGLFYKNSRNIIAAGGLLIGTSQNRVSDNIYDDNKWGNDFNTLQKLSQISPIGNWEEAFQTIFNDDSAYNTKIDATIIQNTYASNINNYEDFVVLDYTIINNSNFNYQNLYVGFYADFDIDISSRNFAVYNQDKKVSYITPAAGGIYAGLKLINDNDSLNIYNFDNDGSDNSINLYDGFLDFEKYNALTTSRDSAGYGNINGKDVSIMISKGPFNLASGDSVNVKFAIFAASHLPGLLNTAENIENIFTDKPSLIKNNTSLKIDAFVSPNPVEDIFKLEIQSEINTVAEISIFNEEGKLMLSESKTLKNGNNAIEFNLSHLNSGVYYLKIETDKESLNKKLIKL
jgi:hypothetical protein